MDDILHELSALDADALEQVRDFVAFLHWRAEQRREAEAADAARAWRFNFLEHLAGADVRSSRGDQGMEVKVAEASVGDQRRPALWQHPPVQGESQVELHVPVPAGLKDVRLRFAAGIRDGAEEGDRLVAFRVRVDGWQVWSRAGWPRTWEPVEVPLPFQAGDILRITFATDALGRHPFAWAVWGEPELVGTVAAHPADSMTKPTP